MAKNDSFVVIYKILSYLYACLKDGSEPDLNGIAAKMKEWGLGEDYVRYIWYNLYSEGYVRGVDIPDVNNLPKNFCIVTKDVEITLKGIEYLQQNGTMKKIADSLGGVFGLANNVFEFFKGV